MYLRLYTASALFGCCEACLSLITTTLALVHLHWLDFMAAAQPWLNCQGILLAVFGVASLC